MNTGVGSPVMEKIFPKSMKISNTFEVNNHFQLHYLGKGLQGFGIFQNDPTWG
jgi:hypothetical protein